MDRTFALEILELYDHDDDPEVKVQASISYHSLLQMDQVNDAIVDTLKQDIKAVGFDFQERRQAAFCGLLSLNRLDALGAEERTGDQLNIHIGSRLDPNIPLIRFILNNLAKIKRELGPDYMATLTEKHVTFWDNASILADQYPEAKQELLGYLANKTEMLANIPQLKFLAKTQPDSHIFLQYCLKTLTDGRYWDSLVAAEMLGEYFSDNDEVLQAIMSDGPITEGKIIALCLGWPSSDMFRTLIKGLDGRKLPLIASMYVCSLSMAPQELFERVLKVLTDEGSLSRHEGIYVINPVIRRMKRDKDLCELFRGHLDNATHPMEIANIPRILIAARGLSTELQGWCREVINNKDLAFKIAFDLHYRRYRSVLHSLLDLVTMSEPK